jgi:hypothetical protein
MAGANHAAPGLVAAIHYQLKRALLHLLTSESDSFIAVEAPWDISVLDKDGGLLEAEEDKNSIIGISQLTDRHESLWKSLRNYTAAFVDGRLKGRDCKLTICTNVAITDGLAAEFIERSWEEADKWVEAKAKALLSSGANPSDAIKPHVEYIKLHRDEFLQVVRHLEVIEGSAVSKDGAASQQIYRLLRASPEERDFVLEALMGWLGEYVADCIARRELAIIPVSTFNTRYREELNRGRQLRLLRRLDDEFAKALTPERKRSHVRDTFQRQLHWVGLNRSPDTLEQAMEDFLRYEVAVTAYAEEANIAKAQFRLREAEVRDQWRVIFNQACFEAPTDGDQQAEIGRGIYHKCSQLDVPLDGVGSCDSYLTRGALHHLADGPDDDPRVGWHPNYRSLAKQLIETSS